MLNQLEQQVFHVMFLFSFSHICYEIFFWSDQEWKVEMRKWEKRHVNLFSLVSFFLFNLICGMSCMVWKFAIVPHWKFDTVDIQKGKKITARNVVEYENDGDEICVGVKFTHCEFIELFNMTRDDDGDDDATLIFNAWFYRKYEILVSFCDTYIPISIYSNALYLLFDSKTCKKIKREILGLSTK